MCVFFLFIISIFFVCLFSHHAFVLFSDDVELHVISLTYKDLAGLSKGDKGGESIDKATFLQNFPVPGLVGGTYATNRALWYSTRNIPECAFLDIVMAEHMLLGLWYFGV